MVGDLSFGYDSPHRKIGIVKALRTSRNFDDLLTDLDGFRLVAHFRVPTRFAHTRPAHQAMSLRWVIVQARVRLS